MDYVSNGLNVPCFSIRSFSPIQNVAALNRNVAAFSVYVAAANRNVYSGNWLPPEKIFMLLRLE